MDRSLHLLVISLMCLVGCSKPPDISGLYTRKASMGRHGGTADIQWDFRSDRTARYQVICDFGKPTANANGSTLTRLISYSGGTWKLEGGEVVFTGEVKTVTDDSLDKDLKEDMVARFRIEPNGDLIGVSGDVSWLPEENWYSMRYAKQR
jgi:hypothetical protein